MGSSNESFKSTLQVALKKAIEDIHALREEIEIWQSLCG